MAACKRQQRMTEDTHEDWVVKSLEIGTVVSGVSKGGNSFLVLIPGNSYLKRKDQYRFIKGDYQNDFAVCS